MKTKRVKPWMWRLAAVAGLSLLVTGPLLCKAVKERTAIEDLAAKAREDAPVNISLAGRRFLFPNKYLFLPSTDEERTPRDETGRFVRVAGQPKALYDFGFFLTYPSLQLLHWAARDSVPYESRMLVALRRIPAISTERNVLTIGLKNKKAWMDERYTDSLSVGLHKVTPLKEGEPDIYYQEVEGEITTLISCSKRRVPHGMGTCSHQVYLSPHQYSVMVEISYAETLLKDWSLIEAQVTKQAQKFEVINR